MDTEIDKIVMVKDSTPPPPFKYIGCRREALDDSAICLDKILQIVTPLLK